MLGKRGGWGGPHGPYGVFGGVREVVGVDLWVLFEKFGLGKGFWGDSGGRDGLWKVQGGQEGGSTC